MTSPADVLSDRDPGDDMQRRLRYQAAYGALLCLECLDNEDFSEVFCEHHEDFLIRKVSGLYIAVQVKTRATHLGAFRSNEAPVTTALRRFVELDKEFPLSFEAFILVTNCDFLDAGDQETNLPHVLRTLRARPMAVFSGTMGSVIDGIKAATGSSKKHIREVLSRVRLEGNLPKFQDITINVATKIATLETYRSLPLERLSSCAVSLINHVQLSSSLTCNQPLRQHFVFSSSPVEEHVKTIISNKRISRDLILQLLAAHLAELTLLHTSQPLKALDLPTGHHVLEKKMAVGGISFPSIAVAKDHQISAEFLLQRWIHMLGPDAATERFQHLDVLVRTRCAEAFDEVSESAIPFGQAMLSRVRTKLIDLAKNKETTYGLTYEQLLGFVSVATQECRQWWSDPFDLQGGEA
jgi:hypothetical protein